jgi:hypothetical protein
LECLSVGAECEKRLRAVVDARLQDKFNEATVNLRKERKYYSKKGSERVRIPADDLDDVLRLDKGLSDDETPSGLIHVEVKRPKGVRKRIISDIAHDRGLSTSMVDKCWKKYRQIKRETD